VGLRTALGIPLVAAILIVVLAGNLRPTTMPEGMDYVPAGG
jgi:hypothetical protein